MIKHITTPEERAKYKRLADIIRQFTDVHQLYNECRHNADMAQFCGVKRDDSDVLIRAGADEQWKVCRKGK